MESNVFSGQFRLKGGNQGKVAAGFADIMPLDSKDVRARHEVLDSTLNIERLGRTRFMVAVRCLIVGRRIAGDVAAAGDLMTVQIRDKGIVVVNREDE